MHQILKRPRLPRPFALPLGLLPQRLNGLTAAQLLNRVFARQRADGELDFLDGRGVRIQVEDASTAFAIGFSPRGFRAATPGIAIDLTVTGTVYDFLLLVTGREDADTLFFRRQLRMEGDTALGVHVKNFLASVDPASLPLGRVVQPALNRGLDAYERLA